MANKQLFNQWNEKNVKFYSIKWYNLVKKEVMAMKKRTADILSTGMVVTYVVAVAFLVVFARINVAMKAYIVISTLLFCGTDLCVRELRDKNDELVKKIDQLRKQVEESDKASED